MKTQIGFVLLLLATTMFIFPGCGKEGPEGPPGKDGNANVIASPWYTPTTWAGQTGDWYFDISSSAINQDIVESGVILAYASLPGDLYDGAVRPLPCWAIGANWDFLIPGYGMIEFTSDALTKPGTSGYSFRFILIPASNFLKSSVTREQYTGMLRNMTYQEVCQQFGISE